MTCKLCSAKVSPGREVCEPCLYRVCRQAVKVPVPAATYLALTTGAA